MELPQIVMLVLYGVFGLSILLHFLIGLIKGRRYSTYAFVSIVLFYLIFFVTMNSFSKFVIHQHQPELYSIMGFTDCNTLVDVVVNLVNQNTDNIMTNNPELIYVAEAISQMLVKIVYFFVLALFYSIISAIVYQFIKKRNLYKEIKFIKLEKKNERYKKNKGKEHRKLSQKIAKMEKNKNYKRHHLQGGLIHGFRGILCCFLSLCVINSVVSIVPDLDTVVISDADDESNNMTLYDYILSLYPEAEVALDIISEYQDSTLNKSTKIIKIGDTTFDNYVLDAILSGDFDGTPLEVRNLMQMFVTIGTDLFVATNGLNMESVNYFNLTKEQQFRIKRVLNTISENEFIMHIFPLAINYALNMESISASLQDKGVKIEEIDFSTIDWKKDIVVIGEIVENVYALETNINEIDFLNASDEVVTYVSNVLNSLSKLTFLNVAIEIGICFAVNTETLAPYKDSILSALEGVVWSDEIKEIGDIYDAFVDLAIGALFINSDEGEESEKVNVLEIITSKTNSQFEALVDAIFSSQFVENIFPSLMSVVKESIVDPRIKELINIDAIGKTGWEDELFCVIEIISQISNNGQNPVTDITLSLNQIGNISTATILKSRLLSDAAIRLLIDTTIQEEPLIEGLAAYIDMPDELKIINEDAIEKYHNEWYDTKDKYGELHIMIEVMKNLVGSIDDFNDPLASIQDVLGTLDLSKQNDPKMNSLTQSKVLHYSLSKTFKNLTTTTEMLVIPNELYDSNGVLAASEIDKLINIVSNVINLSPILVEVEKEVGPMERKRQQQEDKETITKIDLSNYSKIIEIFTDLYDKEEKDRLNLQTVFESDILRATLSNILTTSLEEIITIPFVAINGQIEYTYKDNEPLTVINNDAMTDFIISLIEIGIDTFIDVGTGEISTSIGKIVNALSEIDDVTLENDVLGSSIINATISNILIEQSESNDSFIVIPESSYDSETYDGDVIINTDDLVGIIKIVTAVSGNGENDNDLFGNFDINYILNMNPEELEKVLISSKILHATLSKVIINETGDLLIPLEHEGDEYPVYSIDNNGIEYISVAELVRLFKSLQNIQNIVPDAEDGEEKVNVVEYLSSLDIDKISNFDEEKFEALSSAFDSAIIQVNVGYLLTTQNDIIIPENVKNAVVTTDGSMNIVKKTELDNLFTAFKTIVSKKDSDGNSIKIDLSKPLELVKFIEDDDLDILLSSKILHATLSKTIIELDGIVVSSSVYEGSVGDVDYIRVDEIHAVFNVMKTIDINDILGSETSNVDIISIINSIDDSSLTTILSSDIMHATLSKNLIDQASDLLIPYEFENFAEESESVCFEKDGNNYIEKEELNNLFNAIKELIAIVQKEDADNTLNINDIITSLDTDTIINMSEDSFDILTASAIVRANIAHMIGSQEIESLVIPTNTLTSLKTITGNFNVLKANELSGLFIAVKTLSDTEIDLNNPLKLVSLIDEKQLDTLIDSNIIYATLSSKIIEQDKNGVIIVPSSVYGDSVGNVDFIKSSELKNLLISIKELKLGENEELEDFVEGIDLVSITDKFEVSQLETILASKIIHATITDKINDSRQSIVLPSEVYEDSSKKEFIKIEEFEALFTAISELGIKENETLDNYISSFNPSSMMAFDETQLRTILSSKIIHAAISDKVNAQVVLTIPGSVIDIAEDGTKYIQVDEFVNVLNSLRELGMNEDTELKSFINSIKLSTIIEKNDEQIETIFKSKIVDAVISEKLINEVEKQLEDEMPNGVVELDVKDTAIKYIIDSEIKSLLKSFRVLNVGDSFDNLTSSLSLSKFATYSEMQIDEIVESRIVHALITKQLKSNTGEVLEIPVDAYEQIDGDNYISSTELKAVIKALNILGVSDNASLTNCITPYIFANLDDSQIEDIIKSKIVYAAISKQILDQKATIKISTEIIKVEGITTYIEVEEIKALCAALKLLEVKENSTFDTFLNGISIDKFFTFNTNTISSIVSSSIIHATISEQLLLQEGKINIPEDIKDITQKYLNDDINTDNTLTLIEKEELYAVIKSLNEMGIDGENNTLSLFMETFNTNTFLSYDLDELDIILSSRIICYTASEHIKEDANGFILPSGNEYIDYETQKVICIDYVNNDIEKEEIIHMLTAVEILYGDNFDFDALHEVNTTDFLDHEFGEDEIKAIISSNIIAYNIGHIIEEENAVDGSFHGLLNFEGDINWFYKEGEYEGDLFDLLYALNRMYSNDQTKPLFIELTDASSNYGIVDFLNEDLCNYLTSSRILVNSLDKILPQLTEKNNNTNFDIELDLSEVPTADDAKIIFYRGENIIDGELYKMILAIAKIDNLSSYDSTEDKKSMSSDIVTIMNSKIVGKVINEQFFTDINIVALNEVRANIGKSLLVKPDNFDANTEEGQQFINEFVETWLYVIQYGSYL